MFSCLSRSCSQFLEQLMFVFSGLILRLYALSIYVPIDSFPRLFCYICLLSPCPSAHDFSCLAIHGLHVHPYTYVFFFFSVCQWLASICVSVFLVFVLFEFLVSVTYVYFLDLHGVIVVFSRPVLFWIGNVSVFRFVSLLVLSMSVFVLATCVHCHVCSRLACNLLNVLLTLSFLFVCGQILMLTLDLTCGSHRYWWS